ncbi:signal peptidase I [Pseudonocardia bannensis]|uniref:Signal peptidase I n=1 Tax=Pseudonocardia bannensis TaxID=630973 RepID=A0A848DPE6_9PSEU|nr:signal peptidase I [Pseudonocardia bannensis]
MSVWTTGPQGPGHDPGPQHAAPSRSARPVAHSQSASSPKARPLRHSQPAPWPNAAARRAAAEDAAAGADRSATDTTVRPAGAARTAGRIGSIAVNLVLVTALLAFLVLAVGPRVLPYRTMTMLTGSMAPEISVGDVAVVTPIPVSDVRVGQVLSFQAPTEDQRVVTHRVIDVVTGADGSVSIRTQGDANAGPDPWLARLEGDTAWQWRFTLPAVGAVLRALREPVVHVALVWVLPAGLAAWILLGIWRPAGRGRAGA